MDHRRAHTLTDLRRSRVFGWLTVVLMLFQVVLSTDHLGADAARALGPTSIDRALGILSLCHGDGTIDAIAGDPDGSDHSGRPATPCILCSVAAVAANGVVSHAPEIAPTLHGPLADLVPVVAERPTIRPLLRYGTGRGPPSVLV